MATKIIKGSKFLFGTNNVDKNKVYGYAKINYTVNTTNRYVEYTIDFGSEYYYEAIWAWGPKNNGNTSFKINGEELYKDKSPSFIKHDYGWTKNNGGTVANCVHKTFGPYKVYYNASGKASITLSFLLYAKSIKNIINKKYYNIRTELKETTVYFDDIDPLSATITKLPVEWNINDPLTMTIDNPASLNLDVDLVCNGISLIKRAQIVLTNNTYTLTLTDDERKLIYTEVPDANKATFKIRLRSHISTGKYVEKDYAIKLTYPTKAWVKVDNTWKRAFVWTKINGTWKQCFPWVKVNGTWKRV